MQLDHTTRKYFHKVRLVQGLNKCVDNPARTEVSVYFSFFYLSQEQLAFGGWHPITPHIISLPASVTVTYSGEL